MGQSSSVKVHCEQQRRVQGQRNRFSGYKLYIHFNTRCSNMYKITTNLIDFRFKPLND